MTKKKVKPIFLLFLLLASAMFILPSTVSDEEPEGYNIVGNMVYWENSYGRLEVYPHTSYNVLDHIQYCNFTWYKPTAEIDVAFCFDAPISNSDIWLWKNISHNVPVATYGNILQHYKLDGIKNYTVISEPDTVNYGDIPSLHYINLSFFNNSWVLCGFDTYQQYNSTSALFNYTYWGVTGYTYEEQYYYDWYSIKSLFQHEVFNGKHYYFIKNFNAVQDKTYHVKWKYQKPIGAKGKWDLLAKYSSDSLQYALDNHRYIKIDPWYNSSFNYRKMITINSSYIDNHLEEFTTLVVLNTSITSKCQSDGDDIQFISYDNSTQFNHELEYWDLTNDSIAWVNVTYVNASGTQTYMYVYYNCSGASNIEDMQGTWDSGYVAVHHFQEISGTKEDSSGATWYNLTERYGSAYGCSHENNTVMDGGETANNSDDGFYTSGGLPAMSTFTIEYWLAFANASGDTGDTFINVPTNDPSCFRYNDEKLYVYADGGEQIVSTNTIADTNFHYIVIYADGSDIYLNVDNTAEGSNGWAGSSNNNVWYVLDNSLGSDTFTGTVTEARISNVARNTSYIKACYENYNSYNTFLIWGSEETYGTAPSPPTSLTDAHAGITAINLTWNKGSGADTTRIQRKTGSYPSSYSDGTNVYNGTGSVTGDTGLSEGSVYYYKACSYSSTYNQYSSTGDEDLGYTYPDNVTSATSSKHDGNTVSISFTKGTGADYTYIRRKIGSYPASRSDGDLVYNGTLAGSPVTDTGLYGGHHYYYSLWAYDSDSSYYSSGNNSTHIILIHDPPTALAITGQTHNSIDISWSKGVGANYTHIRYKIGSYPTDITDGTLGYNNTGTATTVGSLSSDTLYYFRAWAFNNGYWNTTYNQTAGYTSPVAPTGLLANTTSTSSIEINWSKTSEYTHVRYKTGSYPSSISDGTLSYNGTGTNKNQTGLTQGTAYYFRAWSFNSTTGLFSSDYASEFNVTIPDPPYSFTISYHNDTTLNISWIKGNGSNNTIIRRSTTSYPVNVTDGTLIYNNTGTYVLDANTTNGTQYYYSAWGYAECGAKHEYSTRVEIEWGFLSVVAYNESYMNQEIWYVLVIYNDTDSYVSSESPSGSIFNNSILPKGSVIVTVMNSTSYYPRNYEMTINSDSNRWIGLKAYLPPQSTAQLYYLYAYTTYDAPIEDVLITVRAYSNITGNFVDVGYTNTDASGKSDFFLVPQTFYQVVLTKSGYNSKIVGLVPISSLTSYIFVMTSLTTYDNLTTVFDTVNYTILPTAIYHNTSINITFSITDTNSSLNYFTMVVTRTNTSNTSEVYNSTSYTASGGTHYYNTTNATATYTVVVSFQKSGYLEYTTTKIYYVGNTVPFTSGLGIPDLLYWIVATIIAIIVTGFAIYFIGGTGVILSPITFGSFVAFNPEGEIAGISVWLILILMGIVTMLLLLFMGGNRK